MPSKDLFPILEARRERATAQPAIALPGAFNGLVGRLIASEGFEAAYVSGAAVSAAKGLPDIGLLTLTEFCDAIRDVHLGSGLPILADADTGFGEEEMVRRTVCEYYSAGAGGFHIEDQMLPKRCGHLDGKVLIGQEEMVRKIKCARKASIDCCSGKFLICARSDARGVTGMYDAVHRSRAYVEAGADMLFPEGLQSEDEFRYFAQEVRNSFPSNPPYLLANMTEFGKSPSLDNTLLGQMGYDVVIYPVSTLRSAMHAVKEFLIDLRKSGMVTNAGLKKMQTRSELYNSLHYMPGQPWEFPTSTAEIVKTSPSTEK